MRGEAVRAKRNKPLRVTSTEVIFGRLLISISGIVLTLPTQAANDGSTDQPVNGRIAAIERSVGGRLGVSVLDTGNRQKD